MQNQEWDIIGGIGVDDTGRCKLCDETFKPPTEEGYQRHVRESARHKSAT